MRRKPRFIFEIDFNRMSKYQGIKTNLPLLIAICILLFAVSFITAGVRAGGPEDIGAMTTPPVADTDEDPVTRPADTTEDQPSSFATDTAVTDPPVTDTPDTPPITEPVDSKPTVPDSPETLGPVDDPRGVTYPNQIAEGEAVGDEYFRDALFIGDSRTNGLKTSTGLEATFYSRISLNISQLTKTDDSSRFITVDVDGAPVKCNVYEALEYYSGYGKVYICMGVCEMGWNEDIFFDTYRKTIEHIKEKMPNAKYTFRLFYR